MLNRARWLMVAIAAVLAIQSNGEGGIRLPDQPLQETDGRSLNFNEDHGRSVSQPALEILTCFLLKLFFE